MSDAELPLPAGEAVDQTAFERATRIMCGFMAAYEVFRHRIITQVRTLFAEGTTDEGPLVSAEYWKIVEPGTNELRACLNWLRDLEAISAEKMRTFDRLRGYRGQIATLFFDQISDEHIETYLKGIQEIDDLLGGIEAWWAIKVRSDADEDSASKRAHTAEHMQRSILTIKMLKRVARDDANDAWRLYQHFLAFKEIDTDTLH
ncbi:MAG: hypothetical protein V3T56_00950 [Gemmatimonadales bacterium]